MNFDSSENEERDDCSRQHLDKISIEENQDLGTIVLFNDMHSNVQPTEVN